MRWIHTIGLVAGLSGAALAGCSGQDDGSSGGETPAPAPAPTPPKFEPGPAVERTLAGLGVTVKAPDNLKLIEADGSARFEAEGFPTVTLTKAKNESGSLGRSTSSGSRRVKRVIKTEAWAWGCESEAPGDFEAALVALCGSMTPAENPHMGVPSCTVTGLDEKAVTAAFASRVPAAGACFTALAERTPKFIGDRWSISVSRTGASTSSGMSTTGYDAEAKGCLGALFDGFKADPALTAEGDFKVSCKAAFSRY